jgi:hypothetical protein
VLDRVSCPTGSSDWIAEIRFLVDEAPQELLSEGSCFELFEGKRCVARRAVIASVPEHGSQPSARLSAEEADEFAQLAANLNRLQVDPHARMAYDLFAGGLIWSDERPLMDEMIEENGVATNVVVGYFRALLNHRTSLIKGEPAVRFRDVWARAVQVCPNWPGFLPTRRDPALAEEYKARSMASLRLWQELHVQLEQQRNATAKTAKA